MSSLIVTDISLAKSGAGGTEQVSIWALKRISEVFFALKHKYETLPHKTDKITRLYIEIEDLFGRITNSNNSGFKTQESVKKVMESFFRKTDRFRITLIQLLLEENELKLLEQMIMEEGKRIMDDCISHGYLSRDNPRYMSIMRKFEDINNTSQTERLILLKNLLSDIAVLFFTCEHYQKTIQKRIQEIITLITSLQLQPVSMQDLDNIHHLNDRLSAIHQIPDINKQLTALKVIEDELSALAHQVSGFEYTDISDLKESRAVLSEEDLKTIQNRAFHIISTIEAFFYHDRIRFYDYDETESSDYEPVTTDVTPDQLALQRENLLLEYGLLKEKIPEKTVIREQLEEMIQNLSLEPDAGSLLDAALILFHEPFPEHRELVNIRRQYDTYYLLKAEKSLSNETWEYVITKLFERLQERGYRIPIRRIQPLRDSFRRSVLEVFTPVRNYSVLISLNPLDELVFRLVRIVDGMDFEDLDSGERLKLDREAAEVWGHDYDCIIQNMNNEHINFIERLRKSSDEVKIHQLTRFDLLTDEHIS